MDGSVSLLVAPALFYILPVVLTQIYRAQEEACQFDTITPECNDTDIILIESAYYGRIRVGVCQVTQEVGHVGCYIDVVPRIAPLCSGRSSCSVEAIVLGQNITRERRQGASFPNQCPEGVVSYLEVTYSCLTVQQFDTTEVERTCNETKQLQLAPPGGYISSGRIGPAGLESCPWVITLPAGQRVRFILYAFSIQKVYLDPESTASPREPRCSAYLYLYDDDQKRIINLCEGYTRERHIYTSGSNSLSFHVMKTVPDMGSFILQYQAQGCAYFEPPENTFVTFEKDLATVVCNFTKETWFLTCGVTSWMGTLGNCTQVEDKNKSNFQWGILIAVAIGVAIGLVVGLSLLGLVYICRRCFCPDSGDPTLSPTRSGSQRGQTTRYKPGEIPPMEELINAANAMAKQGPVVNYVTRAGQAEQPIYDRVGYARQPRPGTSGTPTVTGLIERQGAPMGRPSSEEHIYERYKYRKGDSAASSMSSGPHERIPAYDEPPSGSPRNYPSSTMSTTVSTTTSTAHPVEGVVEMG